MKCPYEEGHKLHRAWREEALKKEFKMSDGRIRLGTDKEVAEVFKVAEEWLKGTKGLWSSVHSPVRSAVAEFQANKNGFTCYQHLATDEEIQDV